MMISGGNEDVNKHQDHLLRAKVEKEKTFDVVWQKVVKEKTGDVIKHFWGTKTVVITLWQEELLHTCPMLVEKILGVIRRDKIVALTMNKYRRTFTVLHEFDGRDLFEIKASFLTDCLSDENHARPNSRADHPSRNADLESVDDFVGELHEVCEWTVEDTACDGELVHQVLEGRGGLRLENGLLQGECLLCGVEDRSGSAHAATPQSDGGDVLDGVEVGHDSLDVFLLIESEGDVISFRES